MSLEQKRIINQFIAEFGFDPFSIPGRQDKLREAAQLALCALERVHHTTDADRIAAADALRAALAEQPAEQVPAGYWDGEFSKDGGATLYEVPQVSVFGHQYRNIPLYREPQPVIPPAQEKQS